MCLLKKKKPHIPEIEIWNLILSYDFVYSWLNCILLYRKCYLSFLQRSSKTARHQDSKRCAWIELLRALRLSAALPASAERGSLPSTGGRCLGKEAKEAPGNRQAGRGDLAAGRHGSSAKSTSARFSQNTWEIHALQSPASTYYIIN